MLSSGKKVLYAFAWQYLPPEDWAGPQQNGLWAVGARCPACLGRAVVCSLDPRKLWGLKLIGRGARVSL